MEKYLDYKTDIEIYNDKTSFTERRSLFDKKIWKVKHVAEYLDCSIKTVYEKARLNEIPSIKKGKFRYFIPEEIENWLLEGN